MTEEYIYPTKKNPLKTLNFKGKIKNITHPKKNISCQFYIILYIETEYKEFIKLHSFKHKKIDLYSSREGNINFKECLNLTLNFTLKISKTDRYNIIKATIE